MRKWTKLSEAPWWEEPDGCSDWYGCGYGHGNGRGNGHGGHDYGYGHSFGGDRYGDGENEWEVVG